MCVDDPDGVRCHVDIVDIASAEFFAGAFDVHLSVCCSLSSCCAVAESKHRCVAEDWLRNCWVREGKSKMGMRKYMAQV